MSARTVVTDEIPELTTPVFRFQIVDFEGVGFKTDTLTLTLYTSAGEAILNLRDEQNVLDTNQVSVDDEGNVEWRCRRQDMAIINDNSALETHVALFEWTWDGESYGKHEIEHRVRNFSQVTS